MRALSLVLSLFIIAGCASTEGSGASVDPLVLSNGDTFANYLRDEGLLLEGPEYTSTLSFLDASILTGPVLGYLVSAGVSGDQSVVQIFPFRDEATAQANVFPIAEARAAPGIGGQRFTPRDKRTYQNGALVVVYYGRDATVRGSLRRALGPVKRR